MKTQLRLAALALMLITAPPVRRSATCARTGSSSSRPSWRIARQPRCIGTWSGSRCWWDPSHTWSGSAKNLTFEPKAGGCFCEKLADGGSVQHGRVIYRPAGKDAAARRRVGAASGYGGQRGPYIRAGPGRAGNPDHDDLPGRRDPDHGFGQAGAPGRPGHGDPASPPSGFRQRAPGWAFTAQMPYIDECAAPASGRGQVRIPSNTQQNTRQCR